MPNSIPTLYLPLKNVGTIFKTLQSQGVVIIPNYANPQQVAHLNHEFSVVQSGIEGSRLIPLNSGFASDISRFEIDKNILPTTFEFFDSPWMQKLSDKFWNDKTLLNDHIYAMEETPETSHVAQDLHFDVTKTLKFFVYLNDICKANGAFECVPSSMKLTETTRKTYGSEINYDDRSLTRHHPYTDDQIIPVEAGAGSLIIFSTDVWHRSGKVQSGYRRIMRGHTRIAQSTANKRETILSKIKRKFT